MPVSPVILKAKPFLWRRSPQTRARHSAGNAESHIPLVYHRPYSALMALIHSFHPVQYRNRPIFPQGHLLHPPAHPGHQHPIAKQHNRPGADQKRHSAFSFFSCMHLLFHPLQCFHLSQAALCTPRSYQRPAACLIKKLPERSIFIIIGKTGTQLYALSFFCAKIKKQFLRGVFS